MHEHLYARTMEALRALVLLARAHGAKNGMQAQWTMEGNSAPTCTISRSDLRGRAITTDNSATSAHARLRTHAFDTKAHTTMLALGQALMDTPTMVPLLRIGNRPNRLIFTASVKGVRSPKATIRCGNLYTHPYEAPTQPYAEAARVFVQLADSTGAQPMVLLSKKRHWLYATPSLTLDAARAYAPSCTSGPNDAIFRCAPPSTPPALPTPVRKRPDLSKLKAAFANLHDTAMGVPLCALLKPNIVITLDATATATGLACRNVLLHESGYLQAQWHVDAMPSGLDTAIAPYLTAWNALLSQACTIAPILAAHKAPKDAPFTPHHLLLKIRPAGVMPGIEWWGMSTHDPITAVGAWAALPPSTTAWIVHNTYSHLGNLYESVFPAGCCGDAARVMDGHHYQAYQIIERLA